MNQRTAPSPTGRDGVGLWVGLFINYDYIYNKVGGGAHNAILTLRTADEA